MTVSADLPRRAPVADAGLQNIVDISAKVAGKTAAKLDISKYYDPSYLTGS